MPCFLQALLLHLWHATVKSEPRGSTGLCCDISQRISWPPEVSSPRPMLPPLTHCISHGCLTKRPLTFTSFPAGLLLRWSSLRRGLGCPDGPALWSRTIFPFSQLMYYKIYVCVPIYIIDIYITSNIYIKKRGNKAKNQPLLYSVTSVQRGLPTVSARLFLQDRLKAQQNNRYSFAQIIES